jgi:hypothetical protein
LPQTPSPEPQQLLDTFRGPIVGGRWLLVVAATVESGLLAVDYPASRAVLTALLVYNLASLVLVHWLPVRRIPILALLGLDLLFIAMVAMQTGGSESLILGQCYLVIYAGALFYGLIGGLSVGALSALTVVLLIAREAGPEWLDVRLRAPYFIIAGAFAGYLSESLRTWYRRYRASRDDAAARELDDRLAEREFQLARAMQKAAMPSIPRSHPGLDVAARALFARRVSGDFYFFLPDERRLGVVIGDVSGKGLPAALVSTSIGHLLPWLRPLVNPGEALRNLNRDLLDRVPAESFASLVLVEADFPHHELRLWNAGHPPPLLWRASERRVLEGKVFNPILGVFPCWEGEPECWPFEPGDVLLLCTDGLLEVRNQAREEFQTRGAARVLAETASESADDIAAAVLRAAESWGELSDDVTVVVCKRTPFPAYDAAASPFPG